MRTQKGLLLISGILLSCGFSQVFAETPKGESSVIPAPMESNLGGTFLEKYPQLGQHLYREPESNYFFGLGFSPIGLLKDRILFSAHFFQIHYIDESWDNEILNVSYGVTTTKPSYVQSDSFVFRTAPKIRLGSFLSVGAMLGYEYVSFSQISSRLKKNVSGNNYQTPSEAFSTKGMVYGVILSENFTTAAGTRWKVNQVFYRQTYHTDKAEHDWEYYYDNEALRTDTSPIEAGTAMTLELGVLF